MIDKVKNLFRSVPARTFQIVIVVLNAILILLAVIFLIYGVYQKQQHIESSTNLLEGTLSFIDFGIGIMGIVGVLLKKRGLIIASIILMSTSMLITIFLCFTHSVAKEIFPTLYKRSMSNQIAFYYGMKGRASYGRAFTIYVDERQRNKGCCGWSGIDGENMFIQSPWYTAVNFNSTDETPFTLPESCCIKISNECKRATDVRAARDSGAVHKHDCADMFSALVALYHLVMIIEYSCYIILQICTIICHIIFLIVYTSPKV